MRQLLSVPSLTPRYAAAARAGSIGNFTSTSATAADALISRMLGLRASVAPAGWGAEGQARGQMDQPPTVPHHEPGIHRARLSRSRSIRPFCSEVTARSVMLWSMDPA